MNNFKRLMAGLAAATMILSMAACDEEGAPASTTAGTGAAEGTLPSTTTAGTTTTQVTYDTDPAVQEAVDNVVDLIDSDIKVTKKIKYLSWFDFDETTAEFELFKKVFNTPTEGGTENDVDQVVAFENVAYATRYEKLATLIQSGDSPDMFPFETNNFPYGAVKKMFQPIDDLFDLSSPLWKNSAEIMELLKWNGKNYVPVYRVKSNNVLWYRQSVIDELGSADPKELYNEGNWTWDALRDLCYDFQNSGENKYGIDGYSNDLQIINSTGMPLITLENGKLVSNLSNANVERAMDYLTDFCKEDLFYPKHLLNNYSTNYSAWAKGDNLFFNDGDWRFEEHWYKYRDKNGWAADEVQFVPWPRDPLADEYYQTPQIVAYMYCYGSENPEGFKALTECLLASEMDEEVIAANKQQRIDKFGWTQENIDFMYELFNIRGESPLTYVFDFRGGIGEDLAGSSTSENAIGALVLCAWTTDGETFTEAREANSPVIQQRIDDLNATVSQ